MLKGVNELIKTIPAIDIMDGKAVRLYKGSKGSGENIKEYGNPIEIAKELSQYVNFIHIVDLNGAFEGTPKNLNIVQEIIETTGLWVQVGGGFRTYKNIERAYAIGVNYVILGTAAFNLDFLQKVTQDFEGITISLDVKDGRLRTNGWLEYVDMDVEEGFYMFVQYSKRFIYTDTERDGTLDGISNTVKRFWDDKIRAEIIYAGGISSEEDLKKLEGIGFDGAIVGKALYEGRIKLDKPRRRTENE